MVVFGRLRESTMGTEKSIVRRRLLLSRRIDVEVSAIIEP